MNVLIVVTESPYGTDRPYNALRLAAALVEAKANVRLFLMCDAVVAALSGQSAPNGDANLGRRLEALVDAGVEVKMCGLCAETRGVHHSPLLRGVQSGSMPELAQWTLDSDRVLTF